MRRRPSLTYVPVILVVASVLAVAGCGRPSPGTTPPPASGTVTGTHAVTQVGLHTLTVALPSIRYLTWPSVLIVQGRVEKVLPAQPFPAENGPLGTLTPKQYYDTQVYTDYVVAVEKVFRGGPVETVTVRQMGGTVGSVSLNADGYPHMTVGDEFLLFLIPPSTPQPGNALWAAGDAQGYWRIEGDQAVPSVGGFPTLQASLVGEAISTALRQGPPADLPLKPVSLEDAPPGPDLPSDATAAP